MHCVWVTAPVPPLCLLWGHFALELRQWKRPKAYIIAKSRQTSCSRRIVSLIDGQAGAQVAMNPDTIKSLLDLYVLVAVVASICIASSLEKRLKARLPATRPYMWGFFWGCSAVACGPLAVVAALGMAVAGIDGRWETFGLFLALTVWLALIAVSGWFIIQRKRWAWVLGTAVSFNPIVWIINGIYAHNRWGEFGGEAYGSAGTEEEGYELLHDATKLEAGGRVQEALTLYQRIVERCPQTAAAGDAQKSAESLRARLGLACPAPVEAATAPPLPPPQNTEGQAGGLSPVRPDSSRPNLEPELMAALAAKGADILESGVREFEPWAARLLAHLGETIANKVRPDLRQIYNAAHEEVRIRQGRLQATERAPVSPAPSVGTQAVGDSGQARLAAVAKSATEAPLICGQTNSQPSDEPPRQIPAPMGPRPKWRTRRLAVGAAAALAIIAGLVAVWMWLDGAQPPITDEFGGVAVDEGAAKIKPPGVLDRQRDLRARGEKGDVEAQTSLGLNYWLGIGVRKDYAKAAYWYRKAADQGSAEAQDRLGDCYYRGEGVQQDYGEAVKWYRKAADQGDATGQFNLGVCYENGQGTPRSGVEAYKWFSLVLAQAKPEDFIRCDGIIAPPAPVPMVILNGTSISWTGSWASVATPVGALPVKCVSIDGETAKIELQGEPQPRVMILRSGDVVQSVSRGALETRAWLEERMSRVEVVEAQRRAAAFVAKKEGAGGGAGDISPTPEIAEGKRCAGTGFFVTDDGYFVTCEHVVRWATSFHVRSPSGSLPARLIKKDPTIDVAVLKVDGAFRALPVAAQPRVKLGEAVFTVGFPNPVVQGVEPKLTRGEISSLAGARDNPRYYQISVPVQPGNSGGALLDECGNAVGVVTSRLDDVATYQASGALPQNVNYAVKGGLVYSFLSGVPELSGKLKAPRTGRDQETASGAAERAAVLVVAE
jgi:S1-C subfamily serine protease/tetratricopeptide (TPR) repeat protein